MRPGTLNLVTTEMKKVPISRAKSEKKQFSYKIPSEVFTLTDQLDPFRNICDYIRTEEELLALLGGNDLILQGVL